jgi:hypothetical protein
VLEFPTTPLRRNFQILCGEVLWSTKKREIKGVIHTVRRRSETARIHEHLPRKIETVSFTHPLFDGWLK